RNLDAEARALADARSHRDRMIEQAAEAIDDGEPQAQSAAAIAIGVGDLVELVEDVLLLVLRNARPGVPDLDPKTIFAPSAADEHAALRGVAHRVRHEV